MTDCEYDPDGIYEDMQDEIRLHLIEVEQDEISMELFGCPVDILDEVYDELCIPSMLKDIDKERNRRFQQQFNFKNKT